MVVKTREKAYINGYQGDEDSPELDIKSRGFETVKELSLCPSCAKVRNLDEFGREIPTPQVA